MPVLVYYRQHCKRLRNNTQWSINVNRDMEGQSFRPSPQIWCKNSLKFSRKSCICDNHFVNWTKTSSRHKHDWRLLERYSRPQKPHKRQFRLGHLQYSLLNRPKCSEKCYFITLFSFYPYVLSSNAVFQLDKRCTEYNTIR